MSKKTFRNAAISTMAASATVAAVAPAVSAETFSDVSEANYHYNSIMDLTEQGVIEGHEDGTFDPYGSITRGQVADMLVSALDLDIPNNLNDALSEYSDVDASNDYAEQIAAVTQAGIFVGNDHGEFGEYDTITREQMASVLVNGFDLGEYDKGEDVDLNRDSISKPHADNVQILANVGVTDATNNYRAYNDIQRDQFATMFTRTQKVLEEGIPGAAASVSAINNTTVEVDFGEDVEHLADLDFDIEGLDIKDAVVKQTDDSVVVLTTSAQESNTDYVVTEDGEKLGEFTGVSAVIPDDVNITTESVQGTVGEDVTLKAQVDVDEDESAAGIPVTFNITNPYDDNETIEAEANTDEDGVAEYSYTRYYDDAGSTDSVVAYATQKHKVFDSSKVYWGESLDISQEKDNSTLANGAKKVYNVSGEANQTVNIAFEENTNVDPDDLVRSVDVIDSDGDNQGYPYQVTTGGSEAVSIQLDENGEGTFTLSGNDATVTPIVFDNTIGDEDKEPVLNDRELQAKGSSVTFELSHALGLNIDAEGDQRAAAVTDRGMGGRDYTVVATDKDGDRVPEGTNVDVTFDQDDFSDDSAVHITDPDNSDNFVDVQKDEVYSYEANEDGEIEFRLTGDNDGFATPTVFLDNGDTDAELDDHDLQQKAEKTYFVDAKVENSEMTAINEEGDVVTSESADETVTFNYQSQDQNGFDYYEEDNGDFPVSFEVTAGTNDLEVSGDFKDENSPAVVKQGKTETFTVNASEGLASIDVTGKDGTSETNAVVNASAHGLPAQEADFHFDASNVIQGEYTGTVQNLDKDDMTITLDDKKPISYKNAESFTNMNGNGIDKEAFIEVLQDHSNVELTVTPHGDNWAFEVVSVDGESDSGNNSGEKETAADFDEPSVDAGDKEITLTGSTENVDEGEELNLELTGDNKVDETATASVDKDSSFKASFDVEDGIEAGDYTTTVSLNGDQIGKVDFTVDEEGEETVGTVNEKGSVIDGGIYKVVNVSGDVLDPSENYKVKMDENHSYELKYNSEDDRFLAEVSMSYDVSEIENAPIIKVTK